MRIHGKRFLLQIHIEISGILIPLSANWTANVSTTLIIISHNPVSSVPKRLTILNIFILLCVVYFEGKYVLLPFLYRINQTD